MNKYRNWVVSACATVCAAMVTGASAQEALFIDPAGNVGVGTNAPSSRLSVVEDGGGSTTAPFVLSNPSGKLRFVLASSGAGWTFDNVQGASFDISRVGTGKAEMRVFQNGDMILEGTLTERSSRSSKSNIEAIDSENVLEKLAALDLSQWSYKGSTTRHLGPMAGDFHRTFGLGRSAEHIAPKDMAGVAMASAQALGSEVEALKAELGAKKQQVKKLRERLDTRTTQLESENAALRQRVDELADMVGQLATRVGAKSDQMARNKR